MTAKKLAGFLLRIAITGGAMYYAFSKVDIHALLPQLAHIRVGPLLLALLYLHFSQYVSGLRTRYYLHCLKVDFPVKPALQLQYVGGMFNAVLPGGTGGDVYKAWWLKRYTSGSLLNLVKLMIAGRLNGLWALGVLVCVLALFSPPIRALVPHPVLVALGLIVAGTLFYMLVARFVLREPLVQQMRAGVYSFALQMGLLGSAWALAIGLDITVSRLEYVVLFMLSCVAAMMPVSIGGVGVRELAVLYGTKLLGLMAHEGVALAFSFSVINLSIPLVGAIIYSIWKPHGGAK